MQINKLQVLLSLRLVHIVLSYILKTLCNIIDNMTYHTIPIYLYTQISLQESL